MVNIHKINTKEREMSDRTKVTNEVKLLTIAALNICYELQTYHQQNNGQQQETHEKIKYKQRREESKTE